MAQPCPKCNRHSYDRTRDGYRCLYGDCLHEEKLPDYPTLIREARGIIHGLYLGFAHTMTLTQLDEVKAFLDKTKEST